MPAISFTAGGTGDSRPDPEQVNAELARVHNFILRADALLKDLFNTSLSRDKEDSADEQGTLMAGRAGYA